MQIELPDEVVEFMRGLAEEIATQDNRATAAPYYFVVRGQREDAAPSGTTGEDRYFVPDLCESFTRDQLIEMLNDREEPYELEEYISDHCRRYDARFVSENHNVFLTFRGYKEHMQLNGHNYRHKNLKKVTSYVEHASRNPEMEMLCKCIAAFREVEASECDDA